MRKGKRDYFIKMVYTNENREAEAPCDARVVTLAGLLS